MPSNEVDITLITTRLCSVSLSNPFCNTTFLNYTTYRAMKVRNEENNFIRRIEINLFILVLNSIFIDVLELV